MKKICSSFLLLSFLILGCTSKREEAVLQFDAMNTWMSIRAWGNENVSEATANAKTVIQKLDKSISTTNPASEIYALNNITSADMPAKSRVLVNLSPEVFALAGFSLQMAKVTEGAFNPCLYPVTKAWGFTTDSYKVPDEDSIIQLLQKTDFSEVKLFSAENAIEISDGMMIDLGGIGKGYAGDIAIEVMKTAGLEAGLLDLGGNVQVFGNKPDGTSWKIGVRNPVGEGIIAGLEIQTGAVITSGGYERFFTADDGKKYIHIIDPKTGMPVNNGLISVTIVADSGAYADALSTALFVMGKEKAIEFWKSNEGEDFQFIIIKQTEDNKLELLYSEGLKDSFSIVENSETEILEKNVSVIRK